MLTGYPMCYQSPLDRAVQQLRQEAQNVLTLFCELVKNRFPYFFFKLLLVNSIQHRDYGSITDFLLLLLLLLFWIHFYCYDNYLFLSTPIYLIGNLPPGTSSYCYFIRHFRFFSLPFELHASVGFTRDFLSRSSLAGFNIFFSVSPQNAIFGDDSWGH